MDAADLAEWADTTLPDLFDPGLTDSEEIHDDVWDALDALIHETILDAVEDPVDREVISDALMDTAREWFAAHHALLVESIPPASAETLAAFQAKPQVSQHSAEWYAQRRNRLTASEFSQILDGRRGALLRSKIAPAAEEGAGGPGASAPVAIAQADGEMNATSWGHRFEPMVRDIFELECAGVGTICDTLGRFTHPTIPWMSASPDGVVLRGPLAGRLVEIKSPKTRVPGTFVPEDYYVQMQIQMEVCQSEAVEFVEAQFAQRPVRRCGGPDTVELEETPLSLADEAALEAAAWKGRVEVYGHLEAPETWIYRRSRPVEDLEDAIFPDPAPADLPLLESSVWWLTGWFPRTVLRNPGWWAHVGWPAASAFWTEVEMGRGSVMPKAVEDTVLAGWLGAKSIN